MGYLAQNGGNINDKARRDVPLLVKSAKEGDLESIKILINNGANINIEDKNRRTAVYWASKRRLFRCSKVSLRK